MSNIEYELFKNNLLQRPITFLTEENLDKLETHCRRAIRYERGVEHQVVLELLERHKEHLAEREQDKKKIKELEKKNKHLKYLYDDCCKCLLDTIERQKVKDKIEELKKEYEIALEENSTKAFILKCKISALEELLEEK